jgi:uncharacterized membrane protein YphA (DoxX/SURF4 family)
MGGILFDVFLSGRVRAREEGGVRGRPRLLRHVERYYQITSRSGYAGRVGQSSPRLLKEPIIMKTAIVVARILLGLIFVVLGLNGFLLFIPAPPPTGLAGTFYDAMFASHYSVLVFGVQVIAGAMLLLNRFVPLALVLLAAVLANILAFHITMMPSGLPLPLFVTLLWLAVALPLRSHFAPLFAQKAQPN